MEVSAKIMVRNSKVVSELAKEPFLMKIFLKVVVERIYSLIWISNKKDFQKMSFLLLKRESRDVMK